MGRVRCRRRSSVVGMAFKCFRNRVQMHRNTQGVRSPHRVSTGKTGQSRLVHLRLLLTQHSLARVALCFLHRSGCRQTDQRRILCPYHAKNANVIHQNIDPGMLARTSSTTRGQSASQATSCVKNLQASPIWSVTVHTWCSSKSVMTTFAPGCAKSLASAAPFHVRRR